MESIDVTVTFILAEVETISSTHRKLERIKGLPEAFVAVGNVIPLAEETLRLLQQALESQSFDWKDEDEIIESINNGLNKCLELVNYMESILRQVMIVDMLGSGSWPGIIGSYRQILKSTGKGQNIESLILSLLVELRMLLINHSITEDVALSGQDRKLETACKILTEALSSLPASDSSPQPSNKYLAKNQYGTRLFWSAKSGKEEIVWNLLNNNDINLDQKDKKGRTPLSLAAEKGHKTITLLLLQTESDIESKDNTGRTPLSWAAGAGQHAVVQALLDNGSDPESFDNMLQTPLLWAAREGHTMVVRDLLDFGSNIESWDYAGRTPLSWAAGEGHLAIVRDLLDCGSDIESWDNTGRTPLSWAIGQGQLEVVRLLLNHRSDVKPLDNVGRTPRSRAAMKGHKSIVSHLTHAGASMDSVDNNGRTLMSWAAEKGQEAVVILLLDAGADANSKDNDGYTPLSRAADKGHLGVVLQLLMVEDHKASGGISEEVGWLPQYEDGSFVVADSPSPSSKLGVNLHQLCCAHKLQQTDGSDPFVHQNLDLRPQHLSRVDMQNQLSLLCGLAGVFPPGSQPSSAFGWASFLIQEASIFFTSKPDDLIEPGGPVELILQLHQAVSGLVSGAVYLQQSGFCCNQFTALTTSQNDSAQSVIRMNTISFHRVLELAENIMALRDGGFNDSVISRCASTSTDILKSFFDTALPVPSTIDLKLHYCSLAVQLLSLSLVLYSRAHIGGFHPVYLTKPLNRVVLRGSSPNRLQIAAEQHKLSCMGNMVGDDVFAFRLISKTAPIEEIKSPLHLSATCEEIVDSWGPGSLLFIDSKEPSEDKLFGLVIRGGIIQQHGRLGNGDTLFHWGEELISTDPVSAAVFSYRDKIIIGAALDPDREPSISFVPNREPEKQMNAPQVQHQESDISVLGTLSNKQRQSPKTYRSVCINESCKRDTLETWQASQGHRAMLGTVSETWKFVERSFVLQFGDNVLGQIGGNQVKQPGVSAKRAVLDRWTNEGNLLILEELYGLQVSLCTGVARRVSLRDLICHDLMEYIHGLMLPGWEQLEEQAKRAMASKEAFREWNARLNPGSESRKCMVKVVDTLLQLLKGTGFDKNGDRFALLWPNGSEARHCVKMEPEGDQAWCRMLKDKEWSTTFAVGTDLCLEVPPYKCRDKQIAWGGMKTFSTFMFYSESRGDPTKYEKDWQITHDKWYWNGEAGGKVIFLARKDPAKVTELDFHRNFVPKRLCSFVTAVEVLVEITSMEDLGEEVLIACRS